jgi:anion-transporting  ArsA/GET3 family ATPase
MPRVLVCAGGGGVGKTTTSAALALALARRKKKTLVVTVDPARRLADAIGVPIGTTVREARVDARADGYLYALMPDPQGAVRGFIEFLFAGEDAARARVFANPLYGILEGAIAGVHELMSVMLVARAVDEQAFDHVVIDTAPSRHALDLVTYPGRLAALLEGRAMGWIGGLAQRATSGKSTGGGVLSWGKRRVEDALAKAIGARLIGDIAQIFADLSIVRVRFSQVAREAEQILFGEATRFALVAAPTGAARADVLYLARRLEKFGRRPSALVLNRADLTELGFARALRSDANLSAPMRAALAQLEVERMARTAAGDALAAELARRFPDLPLVRLPAVNDRSSAEIVKSLASELDASLAALGLE